MSDFDAACDAIRHAIHLGIMCEELPDMEPDAIERLVLWLASEGIGKRRL